MTALELTDIFVYVRNIPGMPNAESRFEIISGAGRCAALRVQGVRRLPPGPAGFRTAAQKRNSYRYWGGDVEPRARRMRCLDLGSRSKRCESW